MLVAAAAFERSGALPTHVEFSRNACERKKGEHLRARPSIDTAMKLNSAHCHGRFNDTFEFVAVTVTTDVVVLPAASVVATVIE